jgi:nucleoporin NUP82
LIISPQADFIAILTTHTVHISILPDDSQLTAPEIGALKLKTYMLGPTTHVTTQSAIASAMWHPLGINGTCLVTVTEDAVVRLWELSVADRSSFDRPTLAIDLKKLADGTSVDQDFSASVSGTSKGFSPDSFEMEVASACFGSRGSGGWSPMTLWVAMREGDIYALCPLLPEKWSPPSTLIPSLSVSIVAKVAAMEDDKEISAQDKRLAQQQLAWMSEIDVQEPIQIDTPPGEPPADLYTRPSKPGRIPRLQGPFELELAAPESEDELDSLLTDIFVIGAKIDSEELMFGEEDDLEMDEVDQEGLSVGVICTLTSSGILSVYLDVDGVEAQWLPRSTSKALRVLEEDIDTPSLLTFEVLDTSRDGEAWEGNWPVFSQDANSRYSFYVTDSTSINSISLSPWVFRLENELREATAGADFRLDLLSKGAKSSRERIHTQPSVDKSSPLSASVIIQDPDLGHFLLSATPHGPLGFGFESPDIYEDLGHSRSSSPSYTPEPDKPLILCEPRAVYEPAHELEENSGIPALMERLSHSRYNRLLKEDVRLSPATLQIMTDAHKIISEETHRIGAAAAELFRRCVSLQQDLKSHIQKANDVAARVEAITGDDYDNAPAVTANEAIEERIQAANRRQKELTNRLEAFRRRAARGAPRNLSDKEKVWMQEVQTLEGKIISDSGVFEQQSGRKIKEPWIRYEQAMDLKDELLQEVQQIEATEETAIVKTPRMGMKVPVGVRKDKMAKIMSMMDRESALVEAAKNRLERLALEG